MRDIRHFLKITLGLFIISVFSFCVGILIGLHRKNDIFIICDRWNDASDNGFALFKYLRETYPNKPIYYIFDTSQKNYHYEKIKDLGNILSYRSLKMFVYLYFARYIASSHTHIMWLCKDFLGTKIWQQKISCFLQHGVIINKLGEYFDHINQFDIIVTGSALEHTFLEEETKNLSIKPIYTGLARWDRFDKKNNTDRMILVMPTWRKPYYEAEENKNKSVPELLSQLKNTDYFLKWQAFLNSTKLHELLQYSKVSLSFYGHPNLYNFFNTPVFSSNYSLISIANPRKDDLQQFIEKSSLLVTDFSSIFFEFAYLKRPMIYFQFDEAEFRANHYQEGYFSYKRDGFGPIFDEIDDVIDKLEYYINNNFQMELEYLQKTEDHFVLYDDQNSKRNYEAIINFSKEVADG
ncbi:MAG: CDP-glycerol glycerophosphotransferase family protein [Brevinema sp.]